ncbi:unnamed protein product, partial [Rotaria sordida]
MYLQLQFFIFISLLLIIVCPITGESWNYHDLGPDIWSETYPSCAGHSQSPINIKTACTIYRTFTSFNFSSAYNLNHNFTLLNNGHSIVGTYNGNDSSSFKLTGASLNGTFEFSSFHLHWGENSKSGSEHQVNGVKHAGEIHFVHINPETKEIAVLGIFMDSNQNTSTNETIHIRKRHNNIYDTENITIIEWEKYFTTASNLQEINSSTILSLNLSSLMGNNLNDFWRYKGSLTTPPCTEGVIWTVFKTPIIFSENEIDGFRKNISLENYR